MNSYPIHYRGPIPLQNRDTPSLNYAQELGPLRDIYTAQWLKTIDPTVRATLAAHDIAYWRAVHDDTTPYYRTGGRTRYTE